MSCPRRPRIGLPESKLGIYPGFGGTVRLPRLIGADNAIEVDRRRQENKAEARTEVSCRRRCGGPGQTGPAALNLIKGAISGG